MIYPEQYVVQAMTNGTRDAILGFIGGGDVAILGVLYMILRRVTEVRDELRKPSV